MLWHLVDVLAVVLALGVLVVGFPGRKARLARRRVFDRVRPGQSSKASPRRDSSSKA